MSQTNAKHSRKIEDILAIAGVFQAVLYGTSEALSNVGISFGNHEHGGIPWITITIFLGCVLPKTVGRATAGKVWAMIGAGIAKRIGGKDLSSTSIVRAIDSNKKETKD